MKRILIVISSQYGQTAKIAERMQAVLRQQGSDSEILKLRWSADLPMKTLSDYEGFILASPVYVSKFSPSVIEWTKANVAALNAKPNVFFSVSMNAADEKPAAREADKKLIDGFLAETGLKPQRTACMIGAVKYPRYGLLKRWIMRRICAANNGPTDTSREHEFTNWQAVDDFAKSFAPQAVTT